MTTMNTIAMQAEMAYREERLRNQFAASAHHPGVRTWFGRRHHVRSTRATVAD